MPIDYHHQVGLLKDILSEHQSDCCGTVAECEQLERVIKSLMVNTQLDQNVKSVLQDIYTYSQSGVNSSELNDHIQSHQGHLSRWINDIDSFS
ncbi:YtzH-like family protein [Metabacillus herbersteinensis]|uniref:YtzH-like family protein n=1 Tax=Metabacillus herbersteinensis TaxID=283816 RepID=A0ABV6G9M4_9BACI